MKSKSNSKSANYTSLLQDLKAYGLNPEEWQLSRQGRAQYKILKKSDKEFSFSGRSRNSKKWQSLELSDF